MKGRKGSENERNETKESEQIVCSVRVCVCIFESVFRFNNINKQICLLCGNGVTYAYAQTDTQWSLNIELQHVFWCICVWVQSGSEKKRNICSKRFAHHTKIHTIRAINNMMTKHSRESEICDDNWQWTETNWENKVYQFPQNETRKKMYRTVLWVRMAFFLSLYTNTSFWL